MLLIAISGRSVPDAIDAFLDGAFGTAFAFGASINRAVALALVGLGFIFAFRANLTNVGGEGQIAVSGIAATDRKRVVSGQSVSVRVDLGGRRYIKQKIELITLSV